jgi:DNA replication and repair protein RecF
VLVTGPNGAGKTNLLEALHVGSQGFSPRTRSDAQLIRFGRTSARLTLEGRRSESRVSIRVDLSREEGKRAVLNGTRLTAAEQLRREVHALVFTPDRLTVIKSGPAARRAYLDRVLGRLLPARAQLPGDYAAAVVQRNAGLRRAAAGLSSADALAPWTQRVAVLGEELVSARIETLHAVGPAFQETADALGLPAAALSYAGEPPSVRALEERLDRDLERGTTGLGPHLHEVLIRGGARELRDFGSQGEQRLAVLALLLAEAMLLGDRAARPPLLLLDDVLSELDPARRRSLVCLLPAGQTVITATTTEALPAEPAQLLQVVPGKVQGG